MGTALQARSQWGFPELNPQKDFLERGTEKSGINAPKCIISTPKPHELQSVAERLMILSLFFYMYKI